jgi:mRNA interferase MazF
VRRASYVPETGDIIWMSFEPQMGREQRGHRPVLVLSPRAYNDRRALALVCPITSKVKGHSFEIALPLDSEIAGAVLFDQLRSVDWRARHVKFASRAPADVLAEVRERLRPLLGL